MEQTPTTAPPTPTVLLGNGVGSIRRRPPTISVPTPVPFLPPPAPNAAGTTTSYHHNSNNKQLPAKSPALDSLANSGNMGTGSSHGGAAAAANAAMQFLCDDMLHTLNKAIDQHNRRERQSSIPSGTTGGVMTSPETTPQRGGGSGSAGGGAGGVASIMLPLTSTTTTSASAGNPAPQQMLQFSALQPPTISTAFASCPRISSEDVIGSFARQGTTTPQPAGCSSPAHLLQQQTPSSAGTVMDSRHSTNIFEDAPPMSATMTSTVRSTCTATNATSNPLDPNSTSSSPTPAFTFPVTNSPSAVLRKKRAQLDATVAPQSSGTPQPPPPPPVQTLPYFDKGLLATALYAMDRSELSQLVLSMADILGYHAGRAGFHFGGTAGMPTTTPTYGSSSGVRVLDPHNSNHFSLHSPMLGNNGGLGYGVHNSSFHQHTAMTTMSSLPQSPWGPMSPHQSHFAPRPRASVAFLQQQRRGLASASAPPLDQFGVMGGGDNTSMSMFPMPVTPQLVTPMMPHSNISGDLLPQNSVSPSSLGTSLTSVANRPTPKLTKHLEQYTDSEGFTTINNYMLLEEAGAGRFGKVIVANVVGTSELRAIKIIHKSRLRRRWQQLRSASVAMLQPSTSGAGGGGGGPRSEPNSENSFSPPTVALPPMNVAEDDPILSLNREVAVMKRLRHKNIVPLFEAIDDPHEQAMYLVMKYVEKGPIVHLDATWSCPPLDLDYVRCITRQTASGVSYLHRHHIAHRDIKPDNILLGADGVVYLSDFGVSQIFENDDRVTNSDGTPAYAAPEIVRGTEGYSAMKADIWALGVTVYTLVFGCAPFYAPSIIELNEKIAQQPVDYSIRGEMSRDDDFDDVIDLLRRMLERDAEKRISATELVKHKFIFRKRSGTTTTTLSPSAAASKRDDDKNFPLKLPHPSSSANGVVPVISIDAIQSGPATSSLLDGRSYSSPQQKSPSSGVHEQSSDSFGEITAEETYTAFTPLLPRPPPLVVGPGGGGGYRREFAAFGGFE